MFGDYKTDVSFAVAKGCFYGNQLILGAFGRSQNLLPSLFALAFDNGLADR